MRMRILLIYFVMRSCKCSECHVRNNIGNHATCINPHRDKDDNQQVAVKMEQAPEDDSQR